MKGCVALKDDQISAVAEAFAGRYSARNKCLFLLGVYTGFRIQELLSLTVSDIYDGKNVRESVTIKKRNTKGKQASYTMALHKAARNAVEAWIDESGTDPKRPLFESRKTGAITRGQAWRILKAAFSLNNVKGNTGTHVMRKTFARRIYTKSGKDLLKTRELLRHKDINSTVQYLSFDNEELVKLVLDEE